MNNFNNNNNNLNRIGEFYQAKCILVTGASGFVGKVLIEKLLSTMPNIERIYLLIRCKRNGKSAEDRLKDELIDSRIFQLRKNCSYPFDKLIAIDGDLTRPRLGLSDKDYSTLVENVSIVFHSAATVRFVGPLKQFIEQNVLGTESIMKLCREMKQLEVN